MFTKENSQKSKSGTKKKRKNKRQATSPLSDNGHIPANSVNTCESNIGQRKKCKSSNSLTTDTLHVSGFPSDFTPNFVPNYTFVHDPSMSFQAQGAQFSMPQQQPYMSSPPPNQMGFGFQVPSAQSAPPPVGNKTTRGHGAYQNAVKGCGRNQKDSKYVQLQRH